MKRAVCPIYSRLHFPAHGSHRGGRGSYGPENTLYTYKKAVHECVTAILEIDLHLSSDGAIVLCHDGSIDATSNGKGYIRDMTIEQLRKYDAAHFFTQDGGRTFPLRGQNITFPTLDEVLDEFLPVKNLTFFFDIKCMEVIDPMLKAITERNIEDRVILGALDSIMNKALLAKKPQQIPLTIDADSMMGGKLPGHPIHQEIVGFYADESARHTLIPELFEALHKKEKKIAVFGGMLNSEEGQKLLIKLKADILFSDRPDILRRTLETHK